MSSNKREKVRGDFTVLFIFILYLGGFVSFVFPFTGVYYLSVF